MNELALFAGAGGGILGGHLLGWRTVCAVEIEDYPRQVLLARQRDGILPRFPIWDDVCTFDGKPWRGRVDVISGGFPCQDISAAGKGAGITGSRSGLWGEMARIIGEVRPRFAFVENSPMLTSRGLGTVLGDLAALGYDAEWGVLGAHHVGAPHKRDRIWIVAYSQSECSRSGLCQDRPERNGDQPANGCQALAHADRLVRDRRPDLPQRETQERTAAGGSGETLPDSGGIGLERLQQTGPETGATDRPGNGRDSRWWQFEPDVDRVVNGLAFRVDRLKAIGNGQVPAVAALAWEILSEGLKGANDENATDERKSRRLPQRRTR